MNQGTANNTTLTEPASALAAPVLEALATRFRAGGLFLAAIRRDGGICHHDSGASAFFQRYVLPLFRSPETDATIASVFHALGRQDSAITVHRLPGVVLALIPHAEKRQPQGFLLLAGREESFSLGEDVVRLCCRLNLDAAWLAQQAAELPAYGEAAMLGQARLLVGALRDQLRMNGLEGELASVSEQLASTYEELSLIYQVSSGMKVNRSAADFFKQTCLETKRVIGACGVGVALRSDPFRRTEPVLHGSLDLPAGPVNRLADELVRIMQDRRSVLVVNDISKEKNLSWLSGYASQLLAVPLQRHDQILGCLYALDKDSGVFDSVDAKLLNSIATESAIYLENSRLFEDMRGLMMGLMHSLTSAVDAKDTYTCGHSERVALLSRQLAIETGLSDQQVEQIYMAGLLHDVGKIGVPESVLQKTGKLTTEEFDQMKKHPEIGARILQDVRQVKNLIPGVLHHHERYDGRGYPHGLAGENIPLMGRIICLGDCFDAMTSNRTYRRALPIEVAMAEIRRCAGTQFDPTLAEVFLRTNAEGYRELLRDHQQKSKKLLDVQENLIAA